MEDERRKEKQKVIKDLRARLNWFLYEAKDEEYNEEEIRALIELIKVMDPVKIDEDYFETEKALERFWKTYDLRNEIYEEFEKLQAGKVSLADYPDDEEDSITNSAVEPEKKNVSKKICRFTSHKGIARLVSAAALVVAVFLGGTVGVYAEKEGFFHWTKKDEKKSAAVISSELSGADTKIAKYDSFEALPEEYQEVIWKPSALPENMKVSTIEVLIYRVMTDIESTYIDTQTDEFVRVSQEIFMGDVTMHDTQYDSFEYVLSENYDSVEVRYLRVENESETECMAIFCLGNQQYAIKSNLKLDVVRSILSESIKDLVS